MNNKEVIGEMIEELNELIDIFQAASHSLDPSNWRKV